MPQPGPQQQGIGTFHAAHGVAGTIVIALVVIYGLHVLGFRFVVAAGVSAGIGR